MPFKDKFSDCDYFRTKDDILFIVRGYYHQDGYIRAVPVFYPARKGKRFNPALEKRFTKYTLGKTENWLLKKHPNYFYNGPHESYLAIPIEDIVEVYKPRDCFKKYYPALKDNVWGKIITIVKETARISLNDIGIFGSLLIGFEPEKDIDFIVYGTRNCQKVKKLFPSILKKLNLRGMSKKHNLYHVQEYSKILNKKYNSLFEFGRRRWSAIQVADGLLTTIRFAYKDDEIPPNPIRSSPLHEIIVEGKVIDDFGTNFVPRTFLIKTKSGIMKIVSYYWYHQSCVKDGDWIQIRGCLRKDKKTINIDRFNHGIKILNSQL